MNNYLFTDASGRKSKTATMYVVVMVFVLIKFMLSGLTIDLSWAGAGMVTFADLDPMLVGALVGAAGGVYTLRRGQEMKERENGVLDPDDLEHELDMLENDGLP